MSEERVARVSTGMELAYERLGDVDAPPLVLVMGVSGQLIHWPDGLCHALVDRGLQVIRFDNRDAGHSTHLSGAPAPDVPAALRGDLSSASYTLADMAADAVALLDALGIDSAHFVGASMGGGIAQTAAIEHPERVRSLTSMMWTTGARDVGQPHMEAMRELFSGPPVTTREQAIERALLASRVIGSPGFARDEAALRDVAARAFDRAHDPLALARQAVATVASGDRTTRLRALTMPVLIVHGANDLMCDVSGAHATAAAIPHAELFVVDGMGHDLPRALWPKLVSRIAGLVERAEAARATR